LRALLVQLRPDDFVDVDETKAFIHGYTNEDRQAKQK
jgi:hypothetical protein